MIWQEINENGKVKAVRRCFKKFIFISPEWIVNIENMADPPNTFPFFR
jgi:hypothetical protein